MSRPQASDDPSPPADVVRTLDAATLVAYGGATWDWYRTHYDAVAVAAAGLPAPIVDGQLLGALLAEHAQDWAGPRARIARMAFRFASMVFAGETVRVTATSVQREGATVTLTQDVLVGERQAIRQATTVLEVPS